MSEKCLGDFFMETIFVSSLRAISWDSFAGDSREELFRTCSLTMGGELTLFDNYLGALFGNSL